MRKIIFKMILVYVKKHPETWNDDFYIKNSYEGRELARAGVESFG